MAYTKKAFYVNNQEITLTNAAVAESMTPSGSEIPSTVLVPAPASGDVGKVLKAKANGTTPETYGTEWATGGGGTTVIANPTEAATDTLNKIKIVDTVYSVGGGGGGEPAAYLKSASVSGNTLTLTKKDDSTVNYAPDLTAYRTSADQDTIDATKVDKENGKSLVEDTKVASYDTHIANTSIHVTADEKTTWNAKQATITAGTGLAFGTGPDVAKLGINTTGGSGKYLRATDSGVEWATVEAGDQLYADASGNNFATYAAFSAATSFYLAGGGTKATNLIAKGDFVIIKADEQKGSGAQSRWGYKAAAGSYAFGNWGFEYTLGIDAYTKTESDGKFVAKETGKSLVSDTEITKLSGISAGATKVEASTTNGKIKIDEAETTVYTLPSNIKAIAVDATNGVSDGTNTYKYTLPTDVIQGAKYNGAQMSSTTNIPEVKTSVWDGKQDALTIAQLSAVNSGITSAKVSTYDGYATSKQNVLPTTTTAGQVLKSTTTAGTVEWGAAGGADTVVYNNHTYYYDGVYPTTTYKMYNAIHSELGDSSNPVFKLKGYVNTGTPTVAEITVPDASKVQTKIDASNKLESAYVYYDSTHPTNTCKDVFDILYTTPAADGIYNLETTKSGSGLTFAWAEQKQAKVQAMGSNTKPVYVSAAGTFSAVATDLTPQTRTINSKALSSDITLLGSDIAVSSTNTDKIDVALGKKQNEITTTNLLSSTLVKVEDVFGTTPVTAKVAFSTLKTGKQDTLNFVSENVSAGTLNLGTVGAGYYISTVADTAINLVNGGGTAVNIAPIINAASNKGKYLHSKTADGTLEWATAGERPTFLSFGVSNASPYFKRYDGDHNEITADRITTDIGAAYSANNWGTLYEYFRNKVFNWENVGFASTGSGLFISDSVYSSEDPNNGMTMSTNLKSWFTAAGVTANNIDSFKVELLGAYSAAECTMKITMFTRDAQEYTLQVCSTNHEGTHQYVSDGWKIYTSGGSKFNWFTISENGSNIVNFSTYAATFESWIKSGSTPMYTGGGHNYAVRINSANQVCIDTFTGSEFILLKSDGLTIVKATDAIIDSHPYKFTAAE